jgi:hypothetical protein
VRIPSVKAQDVAAAPTCKADARLCTAEQKTGGNIEMKEPLCDSFKSMLSLHTAYIAIYLYIFYLLMES